MSAEHNAENVAPALRRLAEHLASEAARLRCELVAFPGTADKFEHPENRGRCKGETVGVRWDDGFADAVCERHAEEAEKRGALVVRSRRHDGTHRVTSSAKDADS